MADNKKYSELVDKIVDLVGGKDNISFFTHCVTRLRFNIVNKDLVKTEEVKALPGAVGINWAGEQLQVIIGQSVADVFKMICDKHGIGQQATQSETANKNEKKKSSISNVLTGIAGCVSPLLPILIGSGMLKVVIAMLTNLNIMSESAPTLVTLAFVADAAFYFLPVFVGATAARKFGANLSLGMLIGGMLISPTFVEMVGSGNPGSIFGLAIPAASYSSTIFPTICAVFVMGYVERFVAKHSPDALRNILEPLVTLIVMIPLTFIVIAPIGSYLSDGLAWVLVTMYEKFGFISIAIQGAFYPLIVMTGMHVGLIPIAVSNFATLGYEPSIISSGIANINQGIACLAVAVKTKDTDRRATAASGAITAIFGGVTEPALFGINMPLKTPLYGTFAGGIVGGALAGLLHVYSYAFGSSSFPFLLASYIDGGNGLINCLISLLAGAVVTFVATMFLYKEEPVAEKQVA